MGKLKVGDKVEVTSIGVRIRGYGVTVGMVGEIVVESTSDYGCVGVKFDHKIDGHALYYTGTEALGYGATNGLWVEPECLKLIEEEKPMEPQFKNMKIRIKDEEHSRLVQETLFEMGYMWAVGTVVQHTSAPWIMTYKNGNICYSRLCEETFNSHSNQEVELVTTHSFKFIDQEAKRKREEKEALENNIAEMQKQLDEMKQKLEKM